MIIEFFDLKKIIILFSKNLDFCDAGKSTNIEFRDVCTLEVTLSIIVLEPLVTD